MPQSAPIGDRVAPAPAYVLARMCGSGSPRSARAGRGGVKRGASKANPKTSAAIRALHPLPQRGIGVHQQGENLRPSVPASASATPRRSERAPSTSTPSAACDTAAAPRVAARCDSSERGAAVGLQRVGVGAVRGAFHHRRHHRRRVRLHEHCATSAPIAATASQRRASPPPAPRRGGCGRASQREPPLRRRRAPPRAPPPRSPPRGLRAQCSASSCTFGANPLSNEERREPGAVSTSAASSSHVERRDVFAAPSSSRGAPPTPPPTRPAAPPAAARPRRPSARRSASADVGARAGVGSAHRRRWPSPQPLQQTQASRRARCARSRVVAGWEREAARSATTQATASSSAAPRRSHTRRKTDAALPRAPPRAPRRRAVGVGRRIAFERERRRAQRLRERACGCTARRSLAAMRRASAPTRAQQSIEGARSSAKRTSSSRRRRRRRAAVGAVRRSPAAAKRRQGRPGRSSSRLQSRI